MTVYRLFFSVVFLLSTIILLNGQKVVEGYAYESGNRGFIENVKVTLSDINSSESQVTSTDENGKYLFNISDEAIYSVSLEHDLFEADTIRFSSDDADESGKVFLSHELKRSPGYIFEITLAEKNREPNAPKNSMKGALIEVYNNTKEEVVLVVDSLLLPDFKVDLKKGNHYTILVRHPDFLSKRMEAFVDVEGCILCFEGIGDVRPGVSDNLTEGNKQGTLLANVELEKYYEGKIISLSNIYYDYNDFNINADAAAELAKVAVFINDNPNIKIELSSHTDSRGRNDYNMTLSQQRSESAVRYLLDKGNVNPNQITAQGYGETQLLNNCKDGVNCPEGDHAKNRRTELQLLKIESNHPLKSLERMKRDEKFERMLKELEFGGGQVKVEAKEDDSMESMSTKETTEHQIIEESEYIEVSETMVTSTSETAILSSEMESIEEQSSTVETDESYTYVPDSQLGDYTGYKLVIHFSRFPLPDTNKVYSDFPEVIDFLTKDNNHLYMIGDFANRKEATEYLKKTIVKTYKSAYLVGFENGIRVE